jgi:cytochrome c oxidase subunit 2
MLVLLVALLASTIFFTPYGESAGSSGQSVRVTARQFGFVIEPDVVQAKVPVAFLMRSDDVNHSFGVYDEDGVLLAQAQIIPGHTQKLVHTFDQPGTYKVLCLEYCGIGHHLMESTFEVKP